LVRSKVYEVFFQILVDAGNLDFSGGNRVIAERVGSSRSQLVIFARFLSARNRLRGGVFKSAFVSPDGSDIAASERLLAFPEALEVALAPGLAQLAQRLRLDLANTLARDAEHVADLVKGAVGLLADAEAHPQDLFFAW
jgi:hypothetical protein